MSPAERLALGSAGLFLLGALLAGVWKYAQMTRRPDHTAHVYVDIAHRAALLYSFACLVMARLVASSPFGDAVQLAAVGVPIFFFGVAVLTYVAHGLRGQTENQFADGGPITALVMALLILGEVGGIGVLVYGFFRTEVFGAL